MKGAKVLPPEAAFWDMDVKFFINKQRLRRNL